MQSDGDPYDEVLFAEVASSKILDGSGDLIDLIWARPSQTGAIKRFPHALVSDALVAIGKRMVADDARAENGGPLGGIGIELLVAKYGVTRV